MRRLRWYLSMMVALTFSGLSAVAQDTSGVPTTGSVFAIDPQAEYVPGELVVGLERTKEAALAKQSLAFIGFVQDYNPAIESYVVKLPPFMAMEDAALFLQNLPGVRYVEPNYIAYAIATPNDPGYSQQYGLQRIQANLAWDIWQPQRTVYIAIIDTGVDYNHQDLVNKFRRHSNGTIYGWNTLNNTTNANDDNGHGTHVAGIAAAEINNGTGVAGVAAWNPSVPNSRAFVQIMPVKVLSSSGSGSLSSVANGITWAADNGAHILSMSLGASSGAQQLADAVNYAWNRGCLVVAAAGNGGSSSFQYPAAYTNCIAVAATDSADRLAYFSQYGSWVDIAAPGVGVYATWPGNSYRSLDGTSMACPHVSGAAALVWSHAPSLTNQQLRTILETNVDPYQPYSGRTIAPNAGRLNVYRALQAAGNPGQPTLSSLSLSPTSVVGGQSSTGTVTLTAAAPSGGFVVNLSSSNSTVASVPTSVTVPAGQTSATFTVSTTAVSTTTTVTITATAGSVSRQATLTVNPASQQPQLSSLSLSPTSVVGGQSSTGTVTLTAAAPSGGFVVNLSSSNSTVASVPSSVTVPAGQTSATFTVTTRAVSSSTTVTITATAGSVSRQATLTVNPSSQQPQLSSLSLNPTSVVGGQSSTGTVTLTAAAPSGGFVVNLSSSNSTVASVPTSVTVPAGQTRATFTVTTRAVSSTTTVTITATAGGISRQATLTVNPAPSVTLQSLTISPTIVWGGSSATGTVTLSAPAPAGGVVVALRSSRPDRASVPVSVTVPAGATQARFTIRTTSGFFTGEWFTTVTITATLGSTSRSANLTIVF